MTEARIQIPRLFQAVEPDIIPHRRGKSRIASRWFAIAQAGVSVGSLSSHLKKLEYVDFDQDSGRLVATDQPTIVSPGDYLLGYLIPGIDKAARLKLDVEREDERDLWYSRMRDAILESIHQFWFCFGVLAYSSSPIFPVSRLAWVDSPRVHREIVRSIAALWPEFCRLDHRIVGGNFLRRPGDWLRWGLSIPSFCYRMGAPASEVLRLQKLEMTEVGEVIAELAV